MRFPFIGISHHEEVVAELKRQLAERTEESHKWAGLFTKRATGEDIFRPGPVPEPAPLREPEPGEPEVTTMARELGPRASRREIVNGLARKKQKEYAEERRSAILANADQAQKEIEQALNEGKGRAAGTGQA